MNARQEAVLKSSLAETIGDWLQSEEVVATSGLPYLGDSSGELLAEICITTLKAMEDSQSYLRAANMLQESTFSDS